ncbi:MULTISPECIES: hypothetical protein [unclassified Streptomyces]|uniref:hypothetical protein n=1 Tax=unclassified Streptomyces TaxID=2593676 RepID=UPI0033A01821
MALAAGVLSFVRLTPESVLGGGGSAEAEPRAAAPADTAGNAAVTVEAVPSASPTSTAVMGGVSATPTPGVSLAPMSSAPSASTLASPPARDVPAPDATGIPTAPAPTTTPSAAPRPPATTAPAPQPTPSATTGNGNGNGNGTPAPKADPPGLCVPIVGLCVDGLAQPGGLLGR